MTLITFQDGAVVFRDGQVGTEQDCCCGGSCTCTEVPSGGSLPDATPVSVTSNCPCIGGGTLSASGTLGAFAWTDCDPFLPSFGTLEIGFCNGSLFVVAAASWQAQEPDPNDFESSGMSYGGFTGCPENTVTESGGSYSGTIKLTLDVITDGVPSTCDLTITLG